MRGSNGRRSTRQSLIQMSTVHAQLRSHIPKRLEYFLNNPRFLISSSPATSPSSYQPPQTPRTSEFQAPTSSDFPDAALLFVDVSGFTPLCEYYSRQGSRGTEVFAAALNGYFSALVEVIHAMGGDIDCFAGDALLCLFAPVREDMQSRDGGKLAVQQATMCALQLASIFSPHRVDEEHSLTLHTAVGVSKVTSIITGGGASQRYATLLEGDAFPQIAQALKLANSGECVVSSEAWKFLSDGDDAVCIGEDREYGCVCVKSLSKSRQENVFALPSSDKIPNFNANADGSNNNSNNNHRNSTDKSAITSPLAQYRSANERFVVDEVEEWGDEEMEEKKDCQLSLFVAPGVADRLAAAQLHWLAEHRLVTVAFVNFCTPFDLSSANGLSLFQAAVVKSFAIIDEHQGFIRQLTHDDKGYVLIFAFGVPGSSVENNSEAAIRVALLIQRVLKTQLEVDTSVGIATGRVFCGLIGDMERRCEFALLGFTVNLAARLAAVKGNTRTVVCSNTARTALTVAGNTLPSTPSTNSSIHLEPLAPIHVKGSNEAVEIYEASFDAEDAILREPRTGGLLIGRKSDIQRVVSIITNLKESGGIVAVEADAGMGKSALFSTVVSQNQGGRYVCCRVSSTSRTHAYSGIGLLLRRLMDKIQSEHRCKMADWKALFIQQLPPNLARHISLLANTFPSIFACASKMGCTITTDVLTSNARNKMLEQLLVAVFAFLLCPRNPTTIPTSTSSLPPGSPRRQLSLDSAEDVPRAMPRSKSSNYPRVIVADPCVIGNDNYVRQQRENAENNGGGGGGGAFCDANGGGCGGDVIDGNNSFLNDSFTDASSDNGYKNDNFLIEQFAAQRAVSRTLFDSTASEDGDKTEEDQNKAVEEELGSTWILGIDDAHHLDDESWKMLFSLRKEHPCTRILLTIRPMASLSLPSFVLSSLEADRGFRVITLGPLTLEKAYGLICSHLDAAKIPSVLTHYIHERSGGNPLFLQAICKELLEKKIITVSPYGEIMSGQKDRPLPVIIDGLRRTHTLREQPSRLTDIVVSFLDDLSPSLSLLAKVISVMDDLSDDGTLQAVYPVPEQRDSLSQDILALVNLGLLSNNASVFSPSGRAYMFRTAIFKEAAYGMLLHSHKTSLHLAAMVIILPRFPTTDMQWISLLAHHFRALDDDEEALSSLAPLVSLETLYSIFLNAGKMAVRDDFQRDAEGFFKDALRLGTMLRKRGGDVTLLLDASNQLHSVLALSLEVSSPELEALRKQITEHLNELVEESGSKSPASLAIRRRCLAVIARGQVSFLLDSNRQSEIPPLMKLLERSCRDDPDGMFEMRSRWAMIHWAKGDVKEAQRISIELINEWKSQGSPRVEFPDTIASLLRNISLCGFQMGELQLSASATEELLSFIHSSEFDGGEKHRVAGIVIGLAMGFTCLNANTEAIRILKEAFTLIPYDLLPMVPLQSRWTRFVELIDNLLLGGTGRDTPSSKYDASAKSQELTELFKLPFGKSYFSEQARVALRYGMVAKAEELLTVWAERAAKSTFFQSPDIERLKGELCRIQDKDKEAEECFQNAIDEAEKIEWPIQGAFAKMSMGFFLVDKQRYEEAEQLLHPLLLWMRQWEPKMLEKFFPAIVDLEELYRISSEQVLIKRTSNM